MTETPPCHWFSLLRLRHVASAGCILLGIALVLLWIRSPIWRDTLVYLGPAYHCRLVSWRGGLMFFAVPNELGTTVPLTWDVHRTMDTPQRRAPTWAFKFDIAAMLDGSAMVRVPHWLVVLLCAGAAVALKTVRRWRISVRGLLLLTTLTAILAGGVMVISRMRM
jgi:hypothetical protein